MTRLSPQLDRHQQENEAFALRRNQFCHAIAAAQLDFYLVAVCRTDSVQQKTVIKADGDIFAADLHRNFVVDLTNTCLLYTSDAADE